MRIASGTLAALVLVAIVWSPAQAQGVPQGTYLQTCTNVSVQGNTLFATCLTTSGGEQDTSLAGVSRCVGDIGNDNGSLQCNVGGAQNGHLIQTCSGYFALCDASTCTPTGNTITVNVIGGGTANFPEAACTCPIFYGDAVADLLGGNMEGSCDPPAQGQVWSLFTNSKSVPQQINGWAQSGPAAAAIPQLCSKNLALGNKSVNCFSISCDSETYINGVPVATCHCALGESFNGTAVPAQTTFWTYAGQGNQAYCAKYPAATPFTFGN